MRFGELIRARREKLGLSLRDVGKALGLSHVFVGEVERLTRSAFAEKHWVKLAKVLKVKPEIIEKWMEWEYCPSCERKLPL